MLLQNLETASLDDTSILFIYSFELKDIDLDQKRYIICCNIQIIVKLFAPAIILDRDRGQISPQLLSMVMLGAFFIYPFQFVDQRPQHSCAQKKVIFLLFART